MEECCKLPSGVQCSPSHPCISVQFQLKRWPLVSSHSHFYSAYKWGTVPHFKKWGYVYPSNLLKLRLCSSDAVSVTFLYVCRYRNKAASLPSIAETIIGRQWRHFSDGQFDDDCRHCRFESNTRMRNPLPIRNQGLHRAYHHVEKTRHRGNSFLITFAEFLVNTHLIGCNLSCMAWKCLFMSTIFAGHFDPLVGSDWPSFLRLMRVH